jgi:hypothetical protein
MDVADENVFKSVPSSPLGPKDINTLVPSFKREPPAREGDGKPAFLIT